MRTIFCPISAATVLLAALSLHAAVVTLPPHEQIVALHLFDRSLSWVGETPPPETESQALLDCIQALRNKEVDGIGAMERFVQSHPGSGWTPGIKGNLAKVYRERGRYSLALEYWESVWKETKSASDPRTKSVADFTLAHWSSLLASLGRLERLQELYQETAGRTLDRGPLQTIFNSSREGAAMMETKPGLSFRCGTYALAQIALVTKGKGDKASYKLLKIESPKTGFTMAQLVDFAAQFELDLVPVVRTTTELVVPSVVHWKQNHYAAITEARPQANGRTVYRVIDPTFGNVRWLDAQAINAEASGHFLVPKDKATAGWTLISREECQLVYGKGFPNYHPPPGSVCPDPDDATCPPDCPPASGGSGGGGGGGGGGGAGSGGSTNCSVGPCGGGGGGGGSACCEEGGMPFWTVAEPSINLDVKDTPMSYQPTSGPRISLRLFNRQRSPTTPEARIFSTGMNWEFGWLSFIRRDPSVTNQPVTLHSAGGSETVMEIDQPDPDFTKNVRVNSIFSGPTLLGYDVLYKSGGKAKYRYITIFQEMEGTDEVFLTEVVDKAGKSTQYLYDQTTDTDGIVRLKYIVDADGRTNSLGYVSSNPYSTNLITSVTNAFGKTVQMAYDNDGFLTSIIDVVGISSSFAYDGEGWITSLTTPYGTTSFKHTTIPNDGYGTNNIINRALEVTEPNAARHLFIYRDSSTSNMPGLFTTGRPDNIPLGTLYDLDKGVDGVDNNHYYRNSFYWGPRQHVNLSTTNMNSFTTNDYLKARLRHWFHGENVGMDLTVSQVLNIERAPSPDAAGTIEGQKTWYDYDGIADTVYIGSTKLVGAIVRLMPDGTTAYTWYRRDSLGNVTNEISSYTTSGGTTNARTNIFTYDANGVDLLERVGPDGVTNASYTYNGNHQVLTMTNALHETTTYTYHGNGQVSGILRPSGLLTTNEYDVNNRLAWTKDGEVVGGAHVFYRTNGYTYTNGLVHIHTNECGLVTTNTWDAMRRLIKVSYPDSTTIVNCYTNTSRPLDLHYTTDRLGFTTGFTYDQARHRTAVTNANTNVTTFSYCTCGSLDSISDALGNVTLFYYDNQGRLTNTIHPGGLSINKFYDAFGRVTNVTDSAGLSVTNWFNQQGLLVASSNQFGQIGRVLFDIEDRATNIVDANGISITNTYDAMGRFTKRQFPNGGTNTFGYSARGVIAYTNQLGNVTTNGYDVLGRKTNEVVVGISTNSFTYSHSGELQTLTDGKNQVTTWKYDEYCRMTNKLDHLGSNMVNYAYDANGRLTSRQTPAKGTTLYTFDNVGNLSNIVYATSPQIKLQYDKLNRLTNMIDAAGTTAYAFANLDLLSEDGPWSADTVTYTNANRLRTSMTVTNLTGTWTQTNGYDAMKRLTNVTSGAGTFKYWFVPGRPSSLVSNLTLPGSSVISNAFDANGRLTVTRLMQTTNGVLNSHGYVYNTGNQRTAATNFYGNTWDYAYDNAGQLVTATGKDGATNRLHEQFLYAYDPAGNLQIRTNNALVQTFVVNALNQLTTNTRSGTLTVSGAYLGTPTNVTVNGTSASNYLGGAFAAVGFSPTDGLNSYTAKVWNASSTNTNTVSVFMALTNRFGHDFNGNLTNAAGLTVAAQLTMAYDDENQLTNVTAPGVWKSDFTYDGRMRLRVAKEYTWNGATWDLGEERHYLYSGMLCIQDRDGSNVPVMTYTRGRDLSGSLQGAGGIGGLLANTDHRETAASVATAYYHADRNGNITALVNTNGVIVGRYSYDPYGNTLTSTGPRAEVNRYRFSSKEQHAKSGLYYYGYRFYVTELQRWLNRDPLTERGGRNLYEFSGNKPPNAIDKFGLLIGKLEEIAQCAANTAKYAVECEENDNDWACAAVLASTAICACVADSTFCTPWLSCMNKCLASDFQTEGQSCWQTAETFWEQECCHHKAREACNDSCGGPGVGDILSTCAAAIYGVTQVLLATGLPGCE